MHSLGTDYFWGIEIAQDIERFLSMNRVDTGEKLDDLLNLQIDSQ
jgi:hypothetical protein